MIYTVLQYPDPKLRLLAKPITEFDANLEVTINNLFETMYEYDGCGLAATQVGLNQSIFVMDISSDRSEPRYFINPEILSQNGEALSEEGCLSLPGVKAKVKRALKITLKFSDKNGQEHTLTATDFEAFCIQHETDHLHGKLYADRLSPLKKALLLKKLEKFQKAG